MQCVGLVFFCVLLNGKPCKECRPQKGLLQGDPLLPYLFIMCAKALFALIPKLVVEASLHGVYVCHHAPLYPIFYSLIIIEFTSLILIMTIH